MSLQLTAAHDSASSRLSQTGPEMAAKPAPAGEHNPAPHVEGGQGLTAGPSPVRHPEPPQAVRQAAVPNLQQEYIPVAAERALVVMWERNPLRAQFHKRGRLIYVNATRGIGLPTDAALYDQMESRCLRYRVKWMRDEVATHAEALAMLSKAFACSPLSEIVSEDAAAHCVVNACRYAMDTPEIRVATPGLVESFLTTVCAGCAREIDSQGRERISLTPSSRVTYCSEMCRTMHALTVSKDLLPYSFWPEQASNKLHAQVTLNGPQWQITRERNRYEQTFTTKPAEWHHSNKKWPSPRLVLLPVKPIPLDRSPPVTEKSIWDAMSDPVWDVFARRPCSRTAVVLGHQLMRAAQSARAADKRPLLFHVSRLAMGALADERVVSHEGVASVMSWVQRYGDVHGVVDWEVAPQQGAGSRDMREACLAWRALLGMSKEFMFYTRSTAGLLGLIRAYLRDDIRAAHKDNITSVATTVCAVCGDAHPEHFVRQCSHCPAPLCDYFECHSRHARGGMCKLLRKESKRAAIGRDIMFTLALGMGASAASVVPRVVQSAIPQEAQKCATPQSAMCATSSFDTESDSSLAESEADVAKPPLH